MHQILVGVIAASALRTFNREVIHFRDIHLIHHIASNLLHAEAIEALLVGISLKLTAIRANDAHLGVFHKLHRLLVTDSALNAVQQRRQFKIEQVVVDRRHLLALLVSLLVVRVVKRTVRREVTTLHHIVLTFGIVYNTHFVIRRVDGDAQVFGGRPFAAILGTAEDIKTTHAGQTVRRIVERRVVAQRREHLATSTVDRATKVDRTSKILIHRLTSGNPEVIVAIAVGHIRREIHSQLVARQRRVQIVIHRVAQVNLHRLRPFAVHLGIVVLLAFASGFAVNSSSALGREIDVAALRLVLARVATREVNRPAVRREPSLTFVDCAVDFLAVIERLHIVTPIALTVLEHGVEVRESLTRPSIVLAVVLAAETRRGENQSGSVVAHKARSPVVEVGRPFLKLNDIVARTIHKQLVHIYYRRLALLGQLVVGHQLQILAIILVRLVEFILKAVHFSHIVIQFWLRIVILLINQTLVHTLRLREVVHKAVALAHLEIAAVLLSLVRRNLVVRLLIFLQCGNVLLLVEKVVSLLCQTFGLGKGHWC